MSVFAYLVPKYYVGDVQSNWISNCDFSAARPRCMKLLESPPKKKSCLFGIVATVLLTSKNVSFFLTNENNRLYNYISICIYSQFVYV